MFEPNLTFMSKNHLNTIVFLKGTIKNTENEVLSQVKLRNEFRLLQTIPGVDKILVLIIMLEVGDIKRFHKAGN